MNFRAGEFGRRPVLAMLGVMSGILWGGAAAAACFDAAKLPDAGIRRSLNFKPVSPDPKKSCSGCAFFVNGAQGDCGKCAIFNGGPVSAQSVCDSWAAKS
ncbi:high-potential iron-sulfur protein [Sphingobium tyrosinilyticum]|uniref:High-potential iron-sulfur protein n=1 Tax=Sphingobium tyrosinilyticum TaxID=2715436 RepID=A0ABV9F1H6_9SPHN